MRFGLSSTLACNILAEVSEQARCPKWRPWLSEREGARGGEGGGRPSGASGEGLCVPCLRT